jgi:hypothetical protein
MRRNWGAKADEVEKVDKPAESESIGFSIPMGRVQNLAKSKE